MRVLRSSISGWLNFSLLLVAATLLSTPASAAAPKDKRPATELLRNALRAEADGAESSRADRLHAILEHAPDFAPARWHSGYVKSGNRWVRFDEAAKADRKTAPRTKYRRLRENCANTIKDQLALANWCRKRKLQDEARAHFIRVLEIDPEHAGARAGAGFRRVHGVWMSEEEIERARARAKRAVADLRKWKPQLYRWKKDLTDTTRTKTAREEALAALLAIEDAGAIPAMELVLSRDRTELALLVVDILAKMPPYEAALALARHAVFHPAAEVRVNAVDHLKVRTYHQYIPAMLSAMHTPVQMKSEMYRAPGGRLLYRHTFYREGQHHRELSVLDAGYQRVRNPEVNSDATGREARDDERQIESAVSWMNQRTRDLNRKIDHVLTKTTGEHFSQPDDWWQWWNDFNEVTVPGRKPLRRFYRQRQTEYVVDRTSCLVAGTPVWTYTGPMPIEAIQVGDLVLAKHVRTGELAYKPVLRTTVRAPAPLVAFRVGEQTIRCTGGHLFWHCGSGWAKSRNFKPGMRLHTAIGTGDVAATGEAGVEPTYNLVVADFHTYFVGEDLLLSHDNTIREPTNAVVPGLMGTKVKRQEDVADRGGNRRRRTGTLFGPDEFRALFERTAREALRGSGIKPPRLP